jgi:PKD repeat protein
MILTGGGAKVTKHAYQLSAGVAESYPLNSTTWTATGTGVWQENPGTWDFADGPTIRAYAICAEGPVENGLSLTANPVSPPNAVKSNFSFNCTPEGFTATSFDWDFGDGTRMSDASDVTSHVYLQSGNYTVTCSAANGGATLSQSTKVLVSLPSFSCVNVADPASVDLSVHIYEYTNPSCDGGMVRIDCAPLGFTPDANAIRWKMDDGEERIGGNWHYTTYILDWGSYWHMGEKHNVTCSVDLCDSNGNNVTLSRTAEYQYAAPSDLSCG